MRKLKIFLFITFILLIVSYNLYIYPRDFTKEFEGIQYRLDEIDKEFAKEVKVKFSGVLSKDFLFGYKFKGDIFINDYKVDINEVKFDKNNKGHLEPYYDDNTGKSISLGMIIIDSNFSKFIIAVNDLPLKTVDGETYGWSTNEGLVITAPAKNRPEASNITRNFSRYLHIPED